MPESNLIRSLTYLMDCFVNEYHDEKVAKNMTELDLRAQIEASDFFSTASTFISTCFFNTFSGFVFLFVYLGNRWYFNRQVQRILQRAVSWLS